MMKKYLAALAFPVFLAACGTQPLLYPDHFMVFESKKMSMLDWSQLSVKTADAIVENLRKVPDNGGGAHLIDGKPAVGSLVARPLYLRPSDPTVPFNRVFRELLSLELTRRGETVTDHAAGAAVINYGIAIVAYGHPPQQGWIPGAATLTVGSLVGIAELSAVSPIGVAFAAGAVVDVLTGVDKVLGPLPNTEVILDVVVKGHDAVLFRDVDYFYIDRQDAHLYVGVFGYGGPAPMQTGPAAPAPVQTRVVRVTSE